MGIIYLINYYQLTRKFWSRLSGPLLKTWFPLTGYAFKQLAKSVLVPFGLTAAAATDTASDNKMFGSGITTFIIWNEEINDNMKIMNRGNKTASWNDKVNLEVLWSYIK